MLIIIIIIIIRVSFLYNVRILHDHSSVAGLHSQALDTIQEKLNEAESSLRLEIEQHRKTNVSSGFVCFLCDQ